MFKFLLFFVGLAVAGCSAFFSVQGLATLYSAQFLSVCIMAGSLEAGKLMAASFLHRYWKQNGMLLKTYLMIAIIVLMSITSLGIFGFLTSAYQTSHAKTEISDVKNASLISKKGFIENEIKYINNRINTLNLARESQEKRLPTMSSKSAKPIYDDIKLSGEEISKSRNRIDELTAEILKINSEIVETKSEATKDLDIGTIKYVAKMFDVTIDEVVKWFTLAIVFVFDPLAVSLILAYNSIVFKPRKRFDEFVEEVEEKNDSADVVKQQKPLSRIYKKVKSWGDKKFENFSPKYRD
jgi:hypothetical protein